MKRWVVVCVVILGLFGQPQQADAQERYCLTSFVECAHEAAEEPSFWWRTVKAIDCELNLVGCLIDLLLW